MNVQIIKGHLEERAGKIYLAGKLDNATLKHLLFDDYQRDILYPAKIESIKKGYREKMPVPAITAGMRGQNFTSTGEMFELLDPVYVIDGKQRVTGAIQLIKETSDPEKQPEVGIEIWFDTSKEYERVSFQELNKNRTSVSINEILRNYAEDFQGVKFFKNLCCNLDFILSNKVSWRTYMGRKDLITASTLLRVIRKLHNHVLTGRTREDVLSLASNIQALYNDIGVNILRQNTILFFNIVDELWNLKDIVYKRDAVWIKPGFLFPLAELFSNHHDFWKGRTLYITADSKRKLQTFPMSDPTVKQMCGSGGTVGNKLLYKLLIEHYDKGKRTGRLRSRFVTEVDAGV